MAGVLIQSATEAQAADTWYQARLPLLMRILRRLRPLLLRLWLPWIQHRRKRNQLTAVEGIEVETAFEVFHPRFFFSSKYLLQELAYIDVAGMRALDMGTGSGIIAVALARRGAEVVAVDVNPAAVQLALRNARRHGIAQRLIAMRSDLFAEIAATAPFDLIVFNPPFYPGEPASPEEAAWRAGSGYRVIEDFLRQAPDYLTGGGRLLLILSSDMPLAQIESWRQRYDYAIAAQRRVRHLFEFFYLLHLTPVSQTTSE